MTSNYKSQPKVVGTEPESVLISCYNRDKEECLKLARPGQIFEVEEGTFTSLAAAELCDIAKDRPVILLAMNKARDLALVLPIATHIDKRSKADPNLYFTMPDYGHNPCNVRYAIQKRYPVFRPAIIPAGRLKVSPFSSDGSGAIGEFKLGAAQIIYNEILKRLMEDFDVHIEKNTATDEGTPNNNPVPDIISNKDAEITRLKSEISDLKEQNEQLQNSTVSAESYNQLKVQMNQMLMSTVSVENHNSEIAKKDKEISELKRAVSVLHAASDKAESEIAYYQREIKRLTAKSDIHVTETQQALAYNKESLRDAVEQVEVEDDTETTPIEDTTPVEKNSHKGKFSEEKAEEILQMAKSAEDLEELRSCYGWRTNRMIGKVIQTLMGCGHTEDELMIFQELLEKEKKGDGVNEG